MRRLYVSVIIPILLLLAGFFAVKYGMHLRRESDTYEISLERVKLIAAKSKVFQIENGRWPTNILELVGLGLDPRVTNDGWGRPIIYKVYPSGSGIVSSYGLDGNPGGSGNSADIHAQFW